MPKLALLFLLFSCGPGADVKATKRTVARPAQRTPAPRSTRLYWSSESIFNMAQLWDPAMSALTRTVAPTSYVTATYGGNLIAMSLMHLADETQAYVNSAWSVQQRPLPLSQYYALILQSGRNDAGTGGTGYTDKASYIDAWDKAIAQGLKYFPRVVVANCPRQALANLSGWDLAANDPMLSATYKTAIDAVWTKYGVASYDLFQDFQDKVTAGTYAVSDLMRDALHPTYASGASVIAAALAAKLNSYTAANSATPTISGRVVNYLFGQPTVGSWSFITGVNALSPANSPVPNLTTLADQFPAISQNGAKLVFPATQATQIWVHWINKATSGGTFTAYVDRGTGSEKSSAVSTTNAALPNYPQNVLIGNSSLGAGTHTVEIETTSANQVAILGITVVGAL